MIYNFLLSCYQNDIRRLRILKRFIFYKFQPYEYFRLEQIRQEMLKIKMENKEQIKETAGSTQWILYLKKRQKQKSNWFNI